MFSTPEIFTVPVFSALLSGAVVWTAIGGVWVWMLIVFVGSALGLLREALRETKRNRRADKKIPDTSPVPAAPVHADREAA